MEEVSDEEEQRLKDLDNPHAVIRYGKQTEAENVPAINIIKYMFFSLSFLSTDKFGTKNISSHLMKMSEACGV